MAKGKKKADRFEVLMDSHQVFVLVDTLEVDRAEEAIKERAEEYSKGMRVPFETKSWTFGEGWDSAERSDRDYLSAIVRPIQGKWNTKILIFRNFGHAWEDSRMQPQLIEKLTQLYYHCDENWVVCFFVGRIGRIPPEVMPFFATMDFPLPSDKDLSELVDEVVDREEIKVNKTTKELSALALKGLTLIEGERALGMAIASGTAKDPINLRTLHSYKAELVKKSGLLEYIPSTETVGTLGGMGVFKEHYTVVSSYFRRRAEAQEYGLSPPRGCCVVGIQGCGKSLSAKVVANLFGLPLYRWDVGKIFGQYVGESEERTRAVLKLAKAISPAVILVDEAEKMFSGAKGGSEASGGVPARVLGEVLYFMEEENTEGAFFYFTCNDIESLPPELIRAGRLDDIWFVDLPTQEERAEIFQIHIAKTGRNLANYDMQALAILTEDFTGADIANIVRKAMFSAFYEKTDYTMNHLINCLKEISPFGKTHEETVVRLRGWAKARAKSVRNEVVPGTSKRRPRKRAKVKK